MAGANPGSWASRARWFVRGLLVLSLFAGADAPVRAEGFRAEPTPASGLFVSEFSALALRRLHEAGLDAGAAPAAGMLPLPKAVDNSALPSFPPLFDQGELESCTAVVSTYYQLTHATGLLRGWDQARLSDSSRFSPAWIYNLTNGGANLGVSLSRAYHALAEHGAVTLETLPYRGSWSGDGDRREAGESALRDEAMANRIASFGVIEGRDPEVFLAELKRLLLKGRLLTGSTAIDGWNRVAVASPPGEASAPHRGESICTEIDPGAPVSHAITIVGYDDDIWFDLDGDGLVGPGERGAFKVVNSWGARDWNAGFRWLHYAAVAHGAPGRSGEEARRGAFWGDRVYWLVPGDVGPKAEYAGATLASASLAAESSAAGVAFQR